MFHSVIVIQTNSDDPVYPLALCHYGKWLAETKSENPVRILEEYLQRVSYMYTLCCYKGSVICIHCVVTKGQLYVYVVLGQLYVYIVLLQVENIL